MGAEVLSWGCYLLECADGTLYAGITNNLERRLASHHRGTASKYTRSRLPVRLVYWESQADRSTASRREAQLKKLDRAAKLKLVSATAFPRVPEMQ
jgi:putative endonuclease